MVLQWQGTARRPLIRRATADVHAMRLALGVSRRNQKRPDALARVSSAVARWRYVSGEVRVRPGCSKRANETTA